MEFGILYLFLVGAVLTTGRFLAGVNVACAVIAAMYGVVDEIHQYFVPYRSATVNDVVKDVIGVLVAYYFVRRAYRKHEFRKIRLFFAGK